MQCRGEQFSFFSCRGDEGSASEKYVSNRVEFGQFAEEAVDFLWLDNSNSDNSGTTRTPHTQMIIDKVDIDVSTNDSGITLYELPQSEVDRIDRNLQGGSDSDIDSDDSTSEEEDDRPPWECYSTRTSRAATRLRLS